MVIYRHKCRSIVLFCDNYGRSSCAKSQLAICKRMTVCRFLSVFPIPLFGMSEVSCRIFYEESVECPERHAALFRYGIHCPVGVVVQEACGMYKLSFRFCMYSEKDFPVYLVNSLENLLTGVCMPFIMSSLLKLFFLQLQVFFLAFIQSRIFLCRTFLFSVFQAVAQQGEPFNVRG